MTNEDKRTWAEIDLGNLRHNYNEIRAKLPPGVKFCGLCKANAYGHGAAPIAKRLERLGADLLAVSCFKEAAELREAGVGMEILVLAPSPAYLAAALARMNAVQAVGELENAKRMSAALAGTGLRLRVHLKLETGMGRTGFNVRTPEGVQDAAEAACLPNLIVEGVFSHFASSDEPESGDYTLGQLSRFLSVADELEERTGKALGIRHCANSGAVVNYPQTALDMVRPGLLLYGLYPGAETGGLNLRPVMTVKTRVCEISNHAAGDAISYGRIYTCPRPCRLAVIPIGYADGLHRVLSGNMDVMINGERAPQVGRICMDMCMVDVTDMPQVRTGDAVTVFGAEPTADELAKKAGTVSYELLCAISPRVERVYIG